jgi:hypothetical protein
MVFAAPIELQASAFPEAPAVGQWSLSNSHLLRARTECRLPNFEPGLNSNCYALSGAECWHCLSWIRSPSRTRDQTSQDEDLQAIWAECRPSARSSQPPSNWFLFHFWDRKPSSRFSHTGCTIEGVSRVLVPFMLLYPWVNLLIAVYIWNWFTNATAKIVIVVFLVEGCPYSGKCSKARRCSS